MDPGSATSGWPTALPVSGVVVPVVRTACSWQLPHRVVTPPARRTQAHIGRPRGDCAAQPLGPSVLRRSEQRGGTLPPAGGRCRCTLYGGGTVEKRTV